MKKHVYSVPGRGEKRQESAAEEANVSVGCQKPWKYRTERLDLIILKKTTLRRQHQELRPPRLCSLAFIFDPPTLHRTSFFSALSKATDPPPWPQTSSTALKSDGWVQRSGPFKVSSSSLQYVWWNEATRREESEAATTITTTTTQSCSAYLIFRWYLYDDIHKLLWYRRKETIAWKRICCGSL